MYCLEVGKFPSLPQAGLELHLARASPDEDVRLGRLHTFLCTADIDGDDHREAIDPRTRRAIRLTANDAPTVHARRGTPP